MKTLKQNVIIKVSPHEIFEALMDSKKHSKFTGGKAIISRKVNGKFSVYDDYASGKNLKIIKDKKIVQTWQTVEWEPSEVSKIIFDLKKVKNGTKIEFTQYNLPDRFYKEISKGWKEHYWDKLKKYFEK